MMKALMALPMLLLAGGALAQEAGQAQAAGQAAGATRDCIDVRMVRESRISREEGYFVRAGGQWFRNTANGCPHFGPGRAVRILTPVPRQCRGDPAEVFQPINAIGYGACTLGPWEEVAAADVPARDMRMGTGRARRAADAGSGERGGSRRQGRM